MTTGMIIAIALFAVALMVIVILFAWVMINNRKRHRQIEADKIRERAKEETLQVNRREALAEETAAKARAVRAEAEVKAAQASGLQQQATSHRNEAMTARAELNQQFERADEMDPPSQTSDTAREDSETRDTPAIQKGPR
jgi:FtsZ-interacting cell division protein ZipA